MGITAHIPNLANSFSKLQNTLLIINIQNRLISLTIHIPCTTAMQSYWTLKLSDIVDGITKDEWFNISYENRAKNLHKAIKRKVSDITKENFITQPCYSVFQSSDNQNNPLFHCLFL